MRLGAAETLALLIDDDASLQETASYTDQLLVSLAGYMKMPSSDDWKHMTEKRKNNQVIINHSYPASVNFLLGCSSRKHGQMYCAF